MAPENLALAQRPLNKIEGAGTATIVDADVSAVQWDFNTRAVTARFGNAYDNANVNAIEVVGHYTANYTFGRVFGITTQALTDTTIAALGGVGVTNCLKPWAVSYQTLIDRLYPPAGTKAPSYNLTQSDVADLTGDSIGNAISLLQGNQNPVTPGNIAQVVTYGAEMGGGNNGYKNAIIGPQCSTLPIGPGTWLDTDPGGGGGQTAGALKTFCDANGGSSGNNNAFTCAGHPRVKLAMWDQNNGSSGNNLRYRVKYVGVFAVTGFTKGTGPGGEDQVAGFFTELSTADGGGFTGAPGPVQSTAIVY
jgi:hypothetical protein